MESMWLVQACDLEFLAHIIVLRTTVISHFTNNWDYSYYFPFESIQILQGSQWIAVNFHISVLAWCVTLAVQYAYHAKVSKKL